MDTHDGKWPRNWEDLQAARDSRLEKGRSVYTSFEKLRSMVKIDWNVDPDVLATAIATGDKFTVKVVTQLDGSRLEANWGPDTEPNQKIARYVTSRHVRTNATVKTEASSTTATNISK